MVLVQGLPVANGIPDNNHTQSFRYTLNISNSLNVQNSGTEQLLFDYELYNASFLYDRKLNKTWWLGLNIPLISYQSGTLDGFIENFHDFFGFRRGHRPYYPQDQFAMRYTENGRTWINQNNPEQGPGDIFISLSRRLSNTHKHQSGVGTYLKLPSGDSRKLTGSGAASLSIIYSYEKNLSETFSTYLNTGLGLLGKGDILPEQQEDMVVFGSALLKWKPLPNTSFKIQLDAHSSFYKNSALPLLNDAVLIAVGGTYRFSDKTALDIAVGEDIKVSASADVNFHFALRKEY